ncbi:hypothetical protein HY439_01895 [Candidatus Microgenomates bacterium]|nr:hypothetical protein [Candidatus Microgenomates bacterium]
MAPRFEVEIPKGQEKAFREQLTKEFPDAQIVFDEEEREKEEEKRKGFLRERFNEFLNPQDPKPEKQEELRKHFNEMLPYIFERKIPSMLQNVETLDEFDQAKKLFLGFCTKVLDLRQIVILIERYGLCDGKFKTQYAVGEIFGLGQVHAGTLERRAVGRLRLYASRPEFQNSIQN